MIGNYVSLNKYDSKTCGVLPDSVVNIDKPIETSSCSTGDGNRIIYIVSNVTTPEPPSQVGLLDGYLNIRIFINGSCTNYGSSTIVSTRVNRCKNAYFITAKSSVVTITKNWLTNCEQGYEEEVQTISYAAGACQINKSPGSGLLKSYPATAGISLSVTPTIASDLTIPRVTVRSG